MDELVNLMEQILAELQEMNSKLDDIKGYGSDNSISDLADKLNDITAGLPARFPRQRYNSRPRP